MQTKNPRIRITNHGAENWRTEAQDIPRTPWVITGPPYATKAEALLHVDYAAWIALGEPMPMVIPPEVAEALAEVDRRQNANGQNGELTALRKLAETVRAAAAGHPELVTSEPEPAEDEPFTSDELRCLVASAAELWDNTDRERAGDYLSQRQQEVLDKAYALWVPEMNGS